MIENDAQLRQTVEQLQHMYLAMAGLYRDIYPVNPERFKLFAEGPCDQIDELQREVDEYTGRNIVLNENAS